MRRLLLTLSVLVALNASAGTGRIIIVNVDPPGVGLNDLTPAQPVGGNPGTTLGQQRLNVYQQAAARWTTMLDTNVDILVEASFASLLCDDTGTVLGQAGPKSVRRDFANAPQPGVWYPIALANKFAGVDLSPSLADISMTYNSEIDNAICQGASNWYYGFDGNEGIHSDFYVVALHELAHGLGFSGATRPPGFRDNLPSVFDLHTLDRTAGLRWSQMSEPQRQVSLTNTGNVVWDGANVKAFANRFLQPVLTLSITEPSSVAGNLDFGTADFGPEVRTTGLSGRLVRAVDASNSAGVSVNDGCTAFTNADAVRGNVAAIDRGNCTFLIKAQNAQAAGATAVVIADRSESYNASNPPTCLPPGMTGAGGGGDVTIPVISVGINDANALRTQFAASATVRGSVRSDPTQLAGMSKEGNVRLYAPCTDSPGSSIHHFDVTASPNLLMEFAVNPDLLLGVDLTQFLLYDIGWTAPPRTGRRALKR